MRIDGVRYPYFITARVCDGDELGRYALELLAPGFRLIWVAQQKQDNSRGHQRHQESSTYLELS